MSYVNNNKGLTVIELMLALVLGLMFLTLAYTMISFGSRTFNASADEYSFQSDFRIAAENFNNHIRYSTVLFGVKSEEFDPQNLLNGWDYIGVSSDQEEIIHFVFNKDTNKHDEIVIVERKPDITYQIEFKKEDPEADDNLLSFLLRGVKGGGGEPVEIQSKLDALNSLQVIDRGYEGNPAVALAFRTDRRPTPENSHAAIAMVLDVSGSMDWGMGGPGTGGPKRIDILKNRATELVAMLEYSSVSLVPFSTHADDPGGFHTFRNVGDVAGRAELMTQINNLDSGGGTNTGDGIRRAYYLLQDFNNNPPAYVGSAGVNYYIIILVDGVTTLASSEINVWRPSVYHGDRVQWIMDGSDIDSTTIYRTVTGYNNYFTGDIADSKAYDHTGLRRPVGRGDNLCIHGTIYVEEIGSLIINSNPEITTFVIGFSGNPIDFGSVANIANNVGATSSIPNQNYYLANDEDELQAVFEDISGQIMLDLWHISGP